MTGWYKLGDGVLEITYDREPESPREWDNLGTFLTFESRSISPDKNPYQDTEELCEAFGVKQVSDLKKNPKYILGYVSKYEHSGVVYSFSRECENPFPCPWDSGIVGVIFVDKERVRKEWNVKRISKKLLETVYSVFEGEVKDYSQWANGEVYSYATYDKEGGVVDSCCGYYDESEILAEHGLSEDDAIGDFCCAYHALVACKSKAGVA